MIKWLVALLVWVGGLAGAFAQTQAVLPNGMTQFVDGNGAPYAGGKVYMYIPSTTTPKTTYQDPYGKSPNQNPIVLDANGRAVIWGNGVYRQVLQDALGNVVWDQQSYASPVGILGNVGIFWYGTATGTTNSITLVGPSGFNGTDGQEVGFIANATNTGATTINPTGYGATVVQKNSASGLVALTGGEIVSGGLFYATYSASAKSFVLENPVTAVSRVAGGVSVPGIVCDGVTDNTSALNTAIAGVTAGTWFVLPTGTCVISGTVVIGKSGVRITGQGENATVLQFSGTGVGDGFEIGTFAPVGSCVGTSAPTGCLQISGVSLSDMTVNALARLGGSLFNLNGAVNVTVENINFNGWDAIETQYVNNVLFANMVGYTNDNSGNIIYLHNSLTSGTTNGWYRSDGVNFRQFVVNAQRKGADCVLWDGAVFTVRIDSVGLLSCNYGVKVFNTAGSGAYFPTFLMVNDLEVDDACSGGIYINAGSDFHISNSFVSTQQCFGAGKFPLLINADIGASFTHGVYITNSQFHDSGAQAAAISGKNVQISNSAFFDTNHSGAGTVEVIKILANAQNVIISNTFAGQRYGDPAPPKYGVVVDAGVGAGPVSMVNMDFTGATTGNVNNLAASPVGWIYGIKTNATLNSATTCAAATLC